VRSDVESAIARVVESGQFILGPEVEAFEREFAEYLGVRHVVGVANGTDALTIALRCLGVGPGDDVVVPSFTFYASAEAIPHTGARPVFCDVDPETFCVTPESVEQALTPATRAVIAVDLFGRVAPSDRLREQLAGRDIAVLEDAAQAAGARLHGRRAGSLGDAGTFSFFPSKNLFCFGDGGAITTDDDEVAAAARQLRFHGSGGGDTHTEVGYNSRLDELQAAGLRVLLPHLPAWTEARRAIASGYAASGLAESLRLPVETAGAECCYHLYVIRSPQRDEVAARLEAAEIGARAYYSIPLHRQPAMREFAPSQPLPNVDAAAAESLALPMGPALTAADVEQVAAALADS
ncbi:MAG: DegT/DnrJ/EryC1/StrS family aminotransferase, partial [Solirubrobacterales bacterium]